MRTLNPIRSACVIAGLTTAAATVAPAPALAAPSDPFLGSYRAIDFDGSEEFLAFGGPDAPVVRRMFAG